MDGKGSNRAGIGREGSPSVRGQGKRGYGGVERIEGGRGRDLGPSTVLDRSTPLTLTMLG